MLAIVAPPTPRAAFLSNGELKIFLPAILLRLLRVFEFVDFRRLLVAFRVFLAAFLTVFLTFLPAARAFAILPSFLSLAFCFLERAFLRFLAAAIIVRQPLNSYNNRLQPGLMGKSFVRLMEMLLLIVLFLLVFQG